MNSSKKILNFGKTGKHVIVSSENRVITTCFMIFMFTVIVLVGLIVYTWGSSLNLMTRGKKHFILLELSSQIVYFDEVLTMSTSMATQTGELKWEDSYRNFKPKLDVAIKKVQNLSSEQVIQNKISQVEQANIKLVTMENQAFDLIRRGDLQPAKNILYGSEYKQQKQIYSSNINEISDKIALYEQAKIEDERRAALITIIFLSVTILLVGIIWLVMWWIITRELSKRKRAEEIQHTLEVQQVEQQNKELIGSERSRRVLLSILEDRKQAEEKLQESEKKFRLLYENAQVGWAFTRINDGKILDCNKRLAQIFGYDTPEACIADYVTSEHYVNPDARPSLLAELEKTGEIRDYENQLIRRDGSVIWIRYSSRMYPEKDYIESLVVDITERKEAEGQLQHIVEGTAKVTSEDFFNALVEHLAKTIGFKYVFVGELTGENLDRIKSISVWGNGGFADNFEYDLKDTPCDNVVGKELCSYPENVQQLFPNDILLRDMGVESYIGAPLIDSNGSSLGILAALHDEPMSKVSFAESLFTIFGARASVELERLQAGEELREYRENLEEKVKERTHELAIAKDQAESADRLKSAFLAAMSHELRTPLNSIIGFTGIMQKEIPGPLNEEQKKQLCIVKNSSQHLLCLINDVLDISKIEAGQMEMNNEPFDMIELIETNVQLLIPLAKSKGLELTYEVSPQVGRIIGDGQRTQQILINFVNNAIKFTNEGSVHVECRAADEHIITRIIDTGIGIKEKDLKSIFKPFQQVDSGLTRVAEGTGLGLSICKKLVELLGGTIQVQSEWGKGSTFTFILPVKKEK